MSTLIIKSIGNLLNISSYISPKADMADVMLSIAAELAPRSKRPRGAQGWCADLAYRLR